MLGHICVGGSCKVGHVNDPGTFCASCVARNDQPDGCLDEALAANMACPNVLPGYFAKGTDCIECGNPLYSAIIAVSACIIGTTLVTYFIIKGFARPTAALAFGTSYHPDCSMRRRCKDNRRHMF